MTMSLHQGFLSNLPGNLCFVGTVYLVSGKVEFYVSVPTV